MKQGIINDLTSHAFTILSVTPHGSKRDTKIVFRLDNHVFTLVWQTEDTTSAHLFYKDRRIARLGHGWMYFDSLQRLLSVAVLVVALDLGDWVAQKSRCEMHLDDIWNNHDYINEGSVHELYKFNLASGSLIEWDNGNGITSFRYDSRVLSNQSFFDSVTNDAFFYLDRIVKLLMGIDNTKMNELQVLNGKYEKETLMALKVQRGDETYLIKQSPTSNKSQHRKACNSITVLSNKKIHILHMAIKEDVSDRNMDDLLRLFCMAVTSYSPKAVYNEASHQLMNTLLFELQNDNLKALKEEIDRCFKESLDKLSLV